MPTGIYMRKPISEETKIKIGLSNSIAQKGKKLSETTKKKMSIIAKERGFGKWMIGKKQSEETRRKKSEVQRGSRGSNWQGGKWSNPEYVKSYIQFNNRKQKLFRKGVLGSHTQNEWEELKKKYSYMCLCCKKQEPFIKLSVDHIIPVSRGGTNNISNIQPLCRSCNTRKYQKTTNFIEQLEIDLKPEYKKMPIEAFGVGAAVGLNELRDDE
jgi:5-methylcytosine-specific restriction endonuclease McrA